MAGCSLLPPAALAMFILLTVITVLLQVRLTNGGLTLTSIPVSLNITPGLGANFSYAVQAVPGQLVNFLGQYSGGYVIYPIVSKLSGEAGGDYENLVINNAEMVGGTFTADFLSDDEHQQTTEDIVCLTGFQDAFDSTFGFKSVWTDIEYQATNGVKLNGTNTYELIYTLDGIRNISYLISRYHKMEVLLDSANSVNGQSAVFWSTPFHLLDSDSLTFESLLRAGNSGTPWCWVFTADTPKVQWNNVMRPLEPMVNVSGFPVVSQGQAYVDPNSTIVFDVSLRSEQVTGPYYFSVFCVPLEYTATVKVSPDKTSFETTPTRTIGDVGCFVDVNNGRLCHAETITFALVAASGPINLQAQQSTSKTIVTSGGNEMKSITCILAIENAKPSANVVLKVPGLQDDPFEDHVKTQSGVYYLYTFKFRLYKRGEFNAECYASNTLVPEITDSDFIAFEVVGGPSFITVDQEDENFNLRAGDDTNKTINCSVTTSDVYPGVVITFKVPGLINGFLEPYDVSTVGNQTVHSFRFRPTKGGAFTGQCCGENTGNSSLSAIGVIDFNVWFGPTDLVASVYESFTLIPGDDAKKSFKCFFTNGLVFPSANVTLTVPGLQDDPLDPIYVSSIGDRTSNIFEFRPSHGGNFTGKYLGQNNQGLSITDQFTFQLEVFSGPNDISAGQDDANFLLYPGDDTNKTITCSYTTADVYPKANIILLVPGLLEGYLDPDDVSIVGSQTVHSFRFRPTKAGTFTAQCYGENSVSDVSNEDYIVLNVLMGPSDLTAGQEYETFSLCPDEDTKKTFTCSLTTSTVYPAARVVLKVPGLLGEPLDPYDASTVGNQTVYYFRFRPSLSGMFTAECYGTNEYGPSITDQDFIDFEVFEPPTSDPEIKSGGKVVVSDTVLEWAIRITLGISCDVRGGHPSVSGVHLTCVGGNSSYELGTHASTQFTVGREHHQMTCRCWADHTTQCYPNTAQFTVHVQEAPTMTDFTVNSQPNQTTVAAGQRVTFVCAAEGIPTADMVIRGKISAKALTEAVDTTVNYYSQTLKVTKTMSCTDSDIYVCNTANGIGNDVMTSVNVTVTCPPIPFEPPEKITFPLGRNGRSRVRIDFVSRPFPIWYKLYRIIIRNSGRKRRETEDETDFLIDESEYTVSFTQTNQRFGSVELDLFQMVTGDDPVNYRLVVANGDEEVGQVRFQTVRSSADDQDYPSSQEQQMTISLIAVSIAAGCAMLLILTLCVYMINSRSKEADQQTKLKKEPTQQRIPWHYYH